ncbi:MAG: hypothetical protein Q8M29_11375 [Bacteroidota bacterium]|nr:hypothetical protein [Bacteroidota bacterium]
MKRLLSAFIILCGFLGNTLVAQYSDTALLRPDVIRYAGKLYVFGYNSADKELVFQLDRFSPEQKKERSATISLGKKECKNFYSIHVDTLHDYLNFVIQEADNDKTCRVVRFDKNLKPVADIEKAEIARVNTFTAHEKEFYYYKNELYVVRPLSKDSAHKFILQKYTVKDSSQVFEYNTGWQLNFAKQSYHRCKIIRVDDESVYMFTNVLGGSKKGQWIQYIDKNTGEIVFSIQLNKEGENYTYLYATHYFDQDNKQLHLAGYKFLNKAVAEDYSKIDYPSGKVKPVPVFICSIDSTGELISSTDNCVLPPTDVEREKEFKQYIFKIDKFTFQNNNYYLLCDVIGSSNGTMYKTYGYAFCALENDVVSGVLKPKPAVFNCTYRDSKIKEAKFIFNTHGVDIKNNAEEVLYKPAGSTAFKTFNWLLSYSGDKIQGASVFSNKKESVVFKYRLEENKWKNAEIWRGSVSPFLKVFAFDTDQILIIKNTSYDPETKIIKGIEFVPNK